MYPMNVPVLLVLLIGSAAAPSAPAPAATPPVHLEKAVADEIIKAVEKDRADTESWLKSDSTSYLATVDRRDFGEKSSLTVGGAADNDVQLNDPGVLPHHLRVTVAGDRFHVEGVDPGAQFKVKNEEKQDAVVDPSTIGVGRFRLRLSHQRFPAIIVYDPKSPRYAAYKGLKYFPVDLSFRYELPLTPNQKPDTTIIMSTRGNRRRAIRVGWYDFTVGKKACRLEADRLLEPGVGENDLSVFFRDATSGKESYPVGRYVDVKELDSGNYVLDFNNAYNPACAFSDHYNCPIPPAANTLPVAIRAGEMDSHYH
jgi:hypothetical protein